MSDQPHHGDAGDQDGGHQTTLNTRYAAWQQKANATYEDYHSRCPGAGGELAEGHSSHGHHTNPVQMETEIQGEENAENSMPRNSQVRNHSLFKGLGVCGLAKMKEAQYNASRTVKEGSS